MRTDAHPGSTRRERPGTVFEILHEPLLLFGGWSVDIEIGVGQPLQTTDRMLDPVTRGLSKDPVTERTPADRTERLAADALFALLGLPGARSLALAINAVLGQDVLTVTTTPSLDGDDDVRLGGIGGVGLELKRPGYTPSVLRRQARRQLDHRLTHHPAAATPHLVWLSGQRDLPKDLFDDAPAVHTPELAAFTDALVRHCPPARQPEARRLAAIVLRHLVTPIGSGQRTRIPDGWPAGVTRTPITLATVELAGLPVELVNGNELVLAPWINQRAGRDYLAGIQPLIASPERLFHAEALLTAAWNDGVLTHPPTRLDGPPRLLEGVNLDGTTHWLLPRPVVRELFHRLDLPVHAGRFPIEAFHRNDTGHSTLYSASAVLRWMIAHNRGTDACTALSDITAPVEA